MKASVKLREGEAPFVRAKLPLSLLGIPIVSGISVGSSKELALHFGSLFEAGPSCRFTYRPNSAENPLSFLIKTGFGLWGSPSDAPLTMSAEVKLSNRGTPSFAVQLKPRLGSFSIRKNAFSPCAIGEHDDQKNKQAAVDESNDFPGIGFSGLNLMPRTPEKSSSELELDEFKCMESSPPSSEGSSVVMVTSEGYGEQDLQQISRKSSNNNFAAPCPGADDSKNATTLTVISGRTSKQVSDWSLIAHTTVPLGRHAVASVRWRVKLASDLLTSFQSRPDCFSLKKLPVLVLDKLSVACCEDPAKRRIQQRSATLSPHDCDLMKEIDNPELGKVASMCSAMKRQLRLLHVENRVLKKTMEDLKAELGGNGKKRQTFMVMNDEELQRQILTSQLMTDSKKDDEAADRSVDLHQGFVIKGGLES